MGGAVHPPGAGGEAGDLPWRRGGSEPGEYPGLRRAGVLCKAGGRFETPRVLRYIKKEVTFVWEWKEVVERCLFTNRLDERLKEFLNRQKPMSYDQERWEFLYTTVHERKRKYLTDFDFMRLPSFSGGWNISAVLAAFSIPDFNQRTLEESLYWAVLAEWIMMMEDRRGERTSDFPKSDFDNRLQGWFRYPKESCLWLHKYGFLEEIKDIYNHSKKVFLYHMKHPEDDNSPWVCGMEGGCSRFHCYYTFFKDNLDDPQIVRLGEFESSHDVWYIIQEKSILYVLQLFDFL